MRYFASEHTMHLWTHTYIASRKNTQLHYCPDSDDTVEHFMFHCPPYDNIRSRLLPAQPKLIYTTRYMDPLHNCNDHPPTIYKPWTDVARLSEFWGAKKGQDKGKSTRYFANKYWHRYVNNLFSVVKVYVTVCHDPEKWWLMFVHNKSHLLVAGRAIVFLEKPA